MKATINGVTVEGSVDEIIEYQRRINVINTKPAKDYFKVPPAKSTITIGDPPPDAIWRVGDWPVIKYTTAYSDNE